MTTVAIKLTQPEAQRGESSVRLRAAGLDVRFGSGPAFSASGQPAAR